jgi:hypothetical protein
MSSLVSRSLLVGCLLSGFALPAGAVTLGFTGSIALQISTLPAIAVSGSGLATVNGSGPVGHLTGVALPSSPFATTALTMPLTDPAALPIAGLQLTAHNGAGGFAGSGGAGFGGVMPILGAAKVCLYAACGLSTNIANLTVPLSVVGQGGIGTVMGLVNLTVVGGAWTTGTAAVGTITMMGGVAPLSNTGAVSGMVTLVTPVLILTNIGAASMVPAFGVMTLHFVPEPGTLTLVLLGLSTCGVIGRRRMRAPH